MNTYIHAAPEIDVKSRAVAGRAHALLAAASFRPPQPIYRVALGVEACYDHNALLFYEVKEGVRKFPHQHAAHLFVHLWEGQRVTPHARQTSIRRA